jgi:16S rRNA processing protein RimM
MNKQDCFKLGYVIKRHGFKGEISIKFDSKTPEAYKKVESLFIEINEQLVPFFIDRLRLNNKGIATVKLEDISNDDQTEQMLRKSVYLPLELLTEDNSESGLLSELVGFEVIDKMHGNIGTLTSVIDQTAQAIFQIDNNGKEILIPAVDAIIDQVRTDNKTIEINAPAGLIELYL